MWGQIAQAIAKVYSENEQTKRHAVDKVMDAAHVGNGNNGADYSNLDTGSEGGGVTEGAGGVGGGYQKPEEQDTSSTAATTKAVGNLAKMGKDALSNIAKKPDDNEGEEEEEKKPEDISGAIGGGAGASAMGGATASDERLKRIFGDNEDAIKCFANINAIKFTYNDTAHDIPGSEEKGVDNDPHYGVKAQELARNPLTESAVQKDPISDYLEVDTKELTMANTAIISEICKRILIIEKVLGIKVV